MMLAKTKRTAIEDIRRVELVQAAHRVFIEHGLGGMTTARICQEAGMSPGILAYYFKGKDEVLFGMVRYNNRVLMEDVIARLNRAKTRCERLAAIIEGNFPAAAFERNTANACGFPSSPQLDQIRNMAVCSTFSTSGCSQPGVRTFRRFAIRPAPAADTWHWSS